MELDLSAGSLVRSGSGLLFVGLGIALLASSKRREPLVRSFGLLFIPFGVSFVLANLIVEAGQLGYIVPTVVYATNLVTIPFAAWHFGREAPLRRLGMSLIGAIALIVALAEYGGQATLPTLASTSLEPIREPFVTPLIIANVLWTGTILAMPIFCAICALGAPAPSASRFALVSCAFSVYLGAAAGSDLLTDASRTHITSYTVPLLAVAILGATSFTWLRVVARGGGKAALAATLVPLAAILVGMVPHLWHADVFNEWGLVGIVRVLAWSSIVYAIVKVDILDLGLAPRSIDRSFLAAGALAVLFIVAQIGQNLLTAQYGLLMGGVVAGAFLFAAQPIQRAMERFSEPRYARAPPPASGDDAEIYRRALRLALRDKRLTRDEELDLHRLATRLGLTGERAHELLIEVEREQEAR